MKHSARVDLERHHPKKQTMPRKGENKAAKTTKKPKMAKPEQAEVKEQDATQTTPADAAAPAAA